MLTPEIIEDYRKFLWSRCGLRQADIEPEDYEKIHIVARFRGYYWLVLFKAEGCPWMLSTKPAFGTRAAAIKSVSDFCKDGSGLEYRILKITKPGYVPLKRGRYPENWFKPLYDKLMSAQ